MIPYLLAVVGGYLLGDSMKESQKKTGFEPYSKKMADGGVLENAADLEIDMDSMNSNTLILELEIGNYDNTESKYFFEYSVDHNERSYSLNAIYDEKDNKVSKELHDELENDKSLDNQLHYAIMDAFQDYADEKYESRNDYNEEED